MKNPLRQLWRVFEDNPIEISIIIGLIFLIIVIELLY